MEANPKLLVKDETLNSSNKLFTVTAGQIWEVNSIFVNLVTSAVAGNRGLEVQLLDSADVVIAKFRPKVLQSATNNSDYLFGPNFVSYDNVANGGLNLLIVPTTPITLPPGFKIRVWDMNAIDAAADDMKVYALGRAHYAGAASV